jgi:hypothetical protein
MAPPALLGAALDRGIRLTELQRWIDRAPLAIVVARWFPPAPNQDQRTGVMLP